jgi:hypothetical protein
MTPIQVLEWLLTDWWQQHGVHLAVQEYQADQWNAYVSRSKQ